MYPLINEWKFIDLVKINPGWKRSRSGWRGSGGEKSEGDAQTKVSRAEEGKCESKFFGIIDDFRIHAVTP